MTDRQSREFLQEAIERRYSRRQILGRAAALGLSAPVIGMVLAACGNTEPLNTGGTGGAATTAPTAATGGSASAAPTAATGGSASAAPTAVAARGTASASATGGGAGAPMLPTGEALNPLKVKDDQALDVVIFKGGYGDDYAVNAEKIYSALFPKAKVGHQGIQRLGEQLQPRFVGGNPPDIIDNSGAGNLDQASLVADGQLTDLADLMEAPAFDSPGKKFKDTLIPNSQETGQYGGKQFSLEYAYTVYGVWYSSSAFKQKGLEYPKTWDKMLAVCEDLKKAGQQSPWIYQGKYPYYMRAIIEQLAYKAGGVDVIRKIDNLEANAWRQPEVKSAVEAVYMLADKGYLYPGTEGLTHTESQAEWLKGKAAFLPCGNWLENESKGLIPNGFDMVVAPTPSLNASDKVPFEGINAYAGENFIVPTKAKNVAGGKELLRILFSKQGARFFSENTKALTVVLGSTDGLVLGPAFDSVLNAVKAAGQNTFVSRYGDWYKQLADEGDNQTGALLTKKLTPAEFIDKMQAKADAVAKDSSIKKYTR